MNEKTSPPLPSEKILSYVIGIILIIVCGIIIFSFHNYTITFTFQNTDGKTDVETGPVRIYYTMPYSDDLSQLAKQDGNKREIKLYGVKKVLKFFRIDFDNPEEPYYDIKEIRINNTVFSAPEIMKMVHVKNMIRPELIAGKILRLHLDTPEEPGMIDQDFSEMDFYLSLRCKKTVRYIDYHSALFYLKLICFLVLTGLIVFLTVKNYMLIVSRFLMPMIRAVTEILLETVKVIPDYLTIYVILIAAFLAFVVFSAALPHTREFDSRMLQSAKRLAGQGDYPKTNGVKLDYYSDAVILNVAYSFDPNQPLRSAIAATFFSKANKPKTHSLLNLIRGNRKDLVKEDYFRYWFGHSAVIKILHYAWNLDNIYILNGALILILSFGAVLYAYKMTGLVGAIGMTFLLSLCNFQVFFMNLEYSPVFMIGLGGLLFLCSRDDTTRRGKTFFILGMLTTYFDLLTAPVLVFGIPALVICGKDFSRLTPIEQRDIKKWLQIWCSGPAAWLAGYILSWGTKLLIGALVCSDIHSVIYRLLLRSGTTTEWNQQITRWEAIRHNLFHFHAYNQPVLLLAGIVLCVLLTVKIYWWKKHKLYFNIGLFCGYLMLAVIPFIVIWIMANHTYVHAPLMTYRGLTLTVAALFMALTAFQQKDDTKKDGLNYSE